MTRLISEPSEWVNVAQKLDYESHTKIFIRSPLLINNATSRP